jgi:hypothetical protein
MFQRQLFLSLRHYSFRQMLRRRAAEKYAADSAPIFRAPNAAMIAATGLHAIFRYFRFMPPAIIRFSRLHDIFRPSMPPAFDTLSIRAPAPCAFFFSPPEASRRGHASFQARRRRCRRCRRHAFAFFFAPPPHAATPAIFQAFIFAAIFATAPLIRRLLLIVRYAITPLQPAPLPIAAEEKDERQYEGASACQLLKLPLLKHARPYLLFAKLRR